MQDVTQISNTIHLHTQLNQPLSEPLRMFPLKGNNGYMRLKPELTGHPVTAAKTQTFLQFIVHVLCFPHIHSTLKCGFLLTRNPVFSFLHWEKSLGSSFCSFGHITSTCLVSSLKVEAFMSQLLPVVILKDKKPNKRVSFSQESVFTGSQSNEQKEDDTQEAGAHFIFTRRIFKTSHLHSFNTRKLL